MEPWRQSLQHPACGRDLLTFNQALNEREIRNWFSVEIVARRLGTTDVDKRWKANCYSSYSHGDVCFYMSKEARSAPGKKNVGLGKSKFRLARDKDA